MLVCATIAQAAQRPNLILVYADDKAPQSVSFENDFDGRTELGKNYSVSEGMEAGWTIVVGVLIGKQVREEHGSVIRTKMDFGDILDVFIDGDKVTRLKSPGIAHPTKTKFGFTVN